MTAKRASVVLVHGAWHGAWCWGPVISALAERDIATLSIDLPGHGNDRGALSDLHGDAERVRQALDACREPVVLVGHSYGGVVITEAGLHPMVSHLVYIASFNLDEGESAMSSAVTESDAAVLDHSGRPDALGHVHVADDGTSTVDDEGARILFYNDCSAATARPRWILPCRRMLSPSEVLLTVGNCSSASAAAFRTKSVNVYVAPRAFRSE